MTHQGFIGSLSTSALLVGAAVAILLLVSAIVAFEGWPGPSSDSPTATFLVRDVGAGMGERPDPELVLEPPRPQETVSAESAGGEDSAGSAAVGGPGGVGGSSAQAVEPGSSASGAEATQLVAPTAPSPGSPPLQDPVGDGTLENAVGSATKAIEGRAGALPQVPEPVERLTEKATQPLGDVIGGR